MKHFPHYCSRCNTLTSDINKCDVRKTYVLFNNKHSLCFCYKCFKKIGGNKPFEFNHICEVCARGVGKSGYSIIMIDRKNIGKLHKFHLECLREYLGSYWWSKIDNVPL